MDYKYIEQLLQRYWDCETSLEEEHILRDFFSQREIPAALERYRTLFVYEKAQEAIGLDADFDRRVLAAAAGGSAVEGNAPVVRAHRITLASRLRPLFRAAAAVAIVTLLGVAAQHSFDTSGDVSEGGWDYNISVYKDSYKDPEKAYETGMKALDMFKRGPKTAAADTATSKTAAPAVSTED